MKPTIAIGLRTATTVEIRELIAKYTTRGYNVEHRTKGLNFNGVLICRLRRRFL